MKTNSVGNENWEIDYIFVMKFCKVCHDSENRGYSLETENFLKNINLVQQKEFKTLEMKNSLINFITPSEKYLDYFPKLSKKLKDNSENRIDQINKLEGQIYLAMYLMSSCLSCEQKTPLIHDELFKRKNIKEKMKIKKSKIIHLHKYILEN